ncbi:MAG: hypothetical protein KDC33_10805 [Thermoleophilia bacterium]|nr:hypothetical protein [Thermoleophilia bacterium]
MDSRVAAVRGVALWIADLAVLTRRYAWAAAGLGEREAAAIVAQASARHLPAAYRRGAATIETVAQLAGAAAAALTTITPPRGPDTIRRDIMVGWTVAKQAPNPEMARAATVNRILTDALTRSWRQGGADQVADNPDVIGYRRVADGGACAVCLALETGDVVPDDEVFEAHPNCLCGMEPVTDGPDPVMRTGQQRFDAMTTAQQDALFYGRGGAAMADLVRSGRVGLADLVHRSPRRPGQTTVVSQRPLKSFTR